MSEAVVLAEIHRRLPGQAVAYGVDHKGPWARIGDVTARGRPSTSAALQAALTMADSGHG